VDYLRGALGELQQRQRSVTMPSGAMRGAGSACSGRQRP